jgi:hypothetical protein
MPLIVVFIVLIAIVVITVAILATRAVRLQWAAAAQALGISIEASSFGHPRLAGTVEGFDVLVEVKGSGDNARTRYRVTYPPVAAPFELRRESGTQRILRMLGAQDVQVGDGTFDEAFLVKTDAPAELTAFLTPARRLSLLRLIATHRSLVASESALEVTTRKVEGKASALEGTVRRLTASAKHLVGTATTATLDEAIASRAAGDLGDSLEQVERAVAADPADLDAQMLRADAALAAGDASRFAAAAEALRSALPADAEADSLQTAAMGWMGRKEPPPATPAAADQTLTNDGALAMFEEVFGGDRLSFESEGEFAATYRGRPVRWSGTVKSARQFEHDRDFGDGPATKAVVTVASIESDLYGNAAVDAVVALPADPGAALERGDVVTFTGTLERADAMMRNVFVRDGRIVAS